MIWFIAGLSLFIIALLIAWLMRRPSDARQLNDLKTTLETFQIKMDERTQTISGQQQHLQTQMSEQLMKSFDALRGQLTSSMEQNAKQSDKQIAQLTERTAEHLRHISQQVEKRLNEGFEKTNHTFQDILKRLTLIDEAQKRIAELSTNVVSLQEVLNNKGARGVFGELQLEELVRNTMPSNSYALQHTFDNGKKADCVLFLPEPTGTIAIDAKFPLENYQRMVDQQLSDSDRKTASQLFKKDIKKHIKDIAEKYIITGETTDSAFMFIPAEAIFAEIHAHHPDLVAEAQQQRRVWMASPTTLMAMLTTARAVLKDDATRKQVHIIQEHLVKLGEDFNRFQMRMDKVSDRIKQAHKEVDEVNVSARKITNRFSKIEQVELDAQNVEQLEKN